MENQIKQVTPPRNSGNKMLIKGAIILAMILLLLIPMTYIQHLVKERAERKQEVTREVSSKWAAGQTLTGPVLMIPYKYYVAQKDNKGAGYTGFAYFLPDDLKIDGQMNPEMKHRSIYEVALYRSGLKMTGHFSRPDWSKFRIDPKDIIWNEAKVLMGISDIRGIEDSIALKWNGQASVIESGLPENDMIKEGVSGGVNWGDNLKAEFEIAINIKGAQSLAFVPLGKQTQVRIRSSWQHPSFEGGFLPVNSHIGSTGFDAMWKIPNTSRPFPQSWVNGKIELRESAFGVRLIDPADHYAKNERAAKYALLFIGLTFLVFFLAEVLQKVNIHPFQYALVGISLCIFYTLLLSLSEYIGFNKAYGIAALATVSLIGFYLWRVLINWKSALIFTTGLSGLYAYIFFLIQLEDYSLLFGSIALFLAVAAVMVVTRKINWYAIGR